MSLDYKECWGNIKNGSEKAFEGLFNEVSSQLYDYVFYLIKDRFASQEIIQDVFLTLWQNRLKIDIKGSVRSYLFRVAHNKSVNYLLQQNTRKINRLKLLPGEIWQSIHDSSETNAYLLEKIEAKETEECIKGAIGELSGQCQKVFVMSRFQYKSIDEISKLLSISPNTVRSHIYNALERIKEVLQKKI